MKRQYCYPNSNVLINRMNIQEQSKLDKVEIAICSTHHYHLYLSPNKIRHDVTVEHLLDLHKFLFSDLYDWAGSFREENIQKSERVLGGESVFYADYKEIKAKLINEIKAFRTLLDIKSVNYTDVARFLSKIWIIHPFREGNTRTCILFVKRILDYYNIPFDLTLLDYNPYYVRDALVMTDVDEFKYLDKIIADAMKNTPDTYQGAFTYNNEKYAISKKEYEEFKMKYKQKKRCG